MTAVRALLAGEPAHLRTTPDARPLRLGLPPAPGRADLGRRPRPAHHAGRPPTSPTAGSPRSWPSTGSPCWSTGWSGHRPGRSPSPRDRSPWWTTTPRTAATSPPPASPGTCAPWATSTPSRSPGRVTTPRSRPSAPRTRAPAPARAASPPDAEALLDQLAAAGSPEHVRAQLDRWDEVADIVMVGLPPGLPWAAIERTLRAAAPPPPRRPGYTAEPALAPRDRSQP